MLFFVVVILCTDYFITSEKDVWVDLLNIKVLLMCGYKKKRELQKK